MTTMSLDLGTPFALARYREGADARLGLVAGDRIRPLDADGARRRRPQRASSPHPDWDRLARARQTATASGCRWPT